MTGRAGAGLDADRCACGDGNFLPGEHGTAHCPLFFWSPCPDRPVWRDGHRVYRVHGRVTLLFRKVGFASWFVEVSGPGSRVLGRAAAASSETKMMVLHVDERINARAPALGYRAASLRCCVRSRLRPQTAAELRAVFVVPSSSTPSWASSPVTGPDGCDWRTDAPSVVAAERRDWHREACPWAWTRLPAEPTPIVTATRF